MQKYLQSTITAKNCLFSNRNSFRELHKQILLHLIPNNGFVRQKVPIFIQLSLTNVFVQHLPRTILKFHSESYVFELCS